MELAALALAACHAHAGPGAVADRPRTTSITVFSDSAVVEQAIDVDLHDGSPVTVRVLVPYDLAPDDIVVADRDGLEIGALHVKLIDPELATPIDAMPEVDDPVAPPESDVPAPPSPDEIARRRTGSIDPPRVIELDVRGSPGHHVARIAYQTTGMFFTAAYTVTTDATRDRATLRGAVEIENITGVTLPRADVTVIDTTSDDWRARRRDELVASFGGPPGTTTAGLVPRPLGRLDVMSGHTRVELLPDEPPRRLHSVLVYDPFGTKLDNVSPMPRTERELGAHASTVVTESFEIERPSSTTAGLPAGRVRLMEREPGGTVTVLGESRLFEPAARNARVDTIPVGTAEGVTAHRERVELTVDEDLKKVVEELAIEVVNDRAAPIEVVLREHAYRGPTWTLAFPATGAIQEGTQQFMMKVRVPAKHTVRESHVVVYRW